MIRSAVVVLSIFALTNADSNSTLIIEETDEPSTAPPPIDDHAVIICSAMSSPLSLRKLASTQGSIASLKLNPDELPGDPITACSKLMCSLKENSSKKNKELTPENADGYGDARIFAITAKRSKPLPRKFPWVLPLNDLNYGDTCKPGHRNKACELLKTEARKHNNLPLLFAEANKWKEIYGNPENYIKYTSGSDKEKQKLLFIITENFQIAWDDFKAAHEPATSTAAPSDGEIVIEFPKFTNKAEIIFPSRWSYLTKKTYIIMGCILFIAFMSLIVLICQILAIRKKKTK